MSLTPKMDELCKFANNHELFMWFTKTWLKDTVDNNAISIDHYSLVWKAIIFFATMHKFWELGIECDY